MKTAERSIWESQIAALGSRATWTQAGVAVELVVGFSVPRDTDPTIASDLGYGVRMVTIRASDTAGRAPRSLDRLDVNGETLTINDATPVVQRGELFGWRCNSSGSGEP